MLKPLIEALTTTGSGREEIIRDAHQRGAFKDLRLVRVALNAIDDVYAPIADFVAQEILPTYGQAIFADLVKNYDPKAKGGAVRRLKLMHRLDPDTARQHVQAALDGGSADMRVAAIECLGGSKESLPFLLEQAKAKNNDVRRAALGAMATLTDPEVGDAIIGAFDGVKYNPETETVDISWDSQLSRIQLVAEAASRNRSAKVLTFLLKTAELSFNQIFSVMKKNAATQCANFYGMLQCFATRDDRRTIAFLTTCFERRDDVGEVHGDVDGTQINRRVASLLLRTRDKATLKMMVDVRDTLPPELLGFAWIAAAQTRTPKEVYERFSSYYLDTSAVKQKKRTDALTKRAAVGQVVQAFADKRHPDRRYYHDADMFWMDGELQVDADDRVQLDLRWLDAALKTDDLGLVLTLARPGHKAAAAYLSRKADELLKQKNVDYRISDVYETIIRIGHPKMVEHLLAALKQGASSKTDRYYCYWLARLIPSLPKSAAPQIEQLLPTLGDAAIDQIAPYLSELQAKA